MRISTIGAYQNGLGLMQNLQVALTHTQQQIASGRRILNPSDDPIASSRSLELQESLSRLTQFDRNGSIAKNRLNHEESVLSNIGDLLQRVRELALQANNATQSDESRALIAVEMREHVNQLVEFANQQDGTGAYLFSGNMDGTLPVARNGSSFSYQGDQGQRLIQIGEGRQIADGDAGSKLFFEIRNGNGIFSASPAVGNTGGGILGSGSVIDPTQYDRDQYTVRFVDSVTYEVLDSSAAIVTTGSFQSGDTISFRGIQISIDGQPVTGDEFDVAPSKFQDVFTTTTALASAVDIAISDNASRAAMSNGINAGILGIDQALGNILEVRTELGSRLAAIDSQEDSNGAFALTLQETLADMQDLDYAEAISRLSLQVSTLEAAQKSFVRTQNLTLFNFI